MTYAREHRRLHLNAWPKQHKETIMTVYVESHHGDGSATIVDTSDGARFKLLRGQWPVVAALRNEDQRARLEEYDQANKQAKAAGSATQGDEQA